MELYVPKTQEFEICLDYSLLYTWILKITQKGSALPNYLKLTKFTNSNE